jgi:hypothetical protein
MFTIREYKAGPKVALVCLEANVRHEPINSSPHDQSLQVFHAANGIDERTPSGAAVLIA